MQKNFAYLYSWFLISHLNKENYQISGKVQPTLVLTFSISFIYFIILCDEEKNSAIYIGVYIFYLIYLFYYFVWWRISAIYIGVYIFYFIYLFYYFVWWRISAIYIGGGGANGVFAQGVKVARTATAATNKRFGPFDLCDLQKLFRSG